jgi:LysM repeat protein
MSDTITLGNFTFEIDDLPEEIPLGGEQMIAVRKFPGGQKDVQVFGVQPKNPSWSAQFNYTNAIDKLRAVYQMFTAGNIIPLQIGSELQTRYVIIRNFEWTYKSFICIPYTIELEIVTQPQSILIPNNTASPNGTTDTTQNIASPPEDTSQQQTYVIQSGDTLWAIAQQYYGDGSLYRKIADANGIENPDDITVGTSIVIP